MLQILKLNDEPIRYSAIILFERKNQEVFPGLLKTLNEVLSSKREKYEIIVVSKGPFDNPDSISHDICNTYGNNIRIFEIAKKASKTVCFKAAFEESHGDIIICCGSHQNISPKSLTKLLYSMDENADIVCLWRNRWYDSTFYKIQSNIFNSLVRVITQSEFHDLSSSVRLFRRQVIQETEMYGNMYRFLPILAVRKGFKAKEVKCSHYKQWCGSNDACGFTSYIERVTDIFALYFISRFASKPLRFFGFLGMVFLLIGTFVNLFILVQKFFLGLPIGDRPFLLLGVFLMVIGIQAASTGLLGEIITFVHGRHKRKYTIEKRI